MKSQTACYIFKSSHACTLGPGLRLSVPRLYFMSFLITHFFLWVAIYTQFLPLAVKIFQPGFSCRVQTAGERLPFSPLACLPLVQLLLFSLEHILHLSSHALFHNGQLIFFSRIFFMSRHSYALCIIAAHKLLFHSSVIPSWLSEDCSQFALLSSKYLDVFFFFLFSILHRAVNGYYHASQKYTAVITPHYVVVRKVPTHRYCQFSWC